MPSQPPAEISRLRAAIRNGVRRIRQIVTLNHRRRSRLRQLRERAAPRFGVDIGWGNPPAWAIKAEGATFVARYLSTDPTKNLTRAEALAYSRHGLDNVVVWETTARRAVESGYSGGVADAEAARREFNALVSGHVLRGAWAIYFNAGDYDVQPADLPAIRNYFRGLCDILGREHVGGYGGLRVIAYLFDQLLIAYGWQTYAWSFGAWDPRAQLQQFSNGHDLAGTQVDYDRAVAVNFGQWSLG